MGASQSSAPRLESTQLQDLFAHATDEEVLTTTKLFLELRKRARDGPTADQHPAALSSDGDTSKDASNANPSTGQVDSSAAAAIVSPATNSTSPRQIPSLPQQASADLAVSPAVQLSSLTSPDAAAAESNTTTSPLPPCTSTAKKVVEVATTVATTEFARLPQILKPFAKASNELTNKQILQHCRHMATDDKDYLVINPFRRGLKPSILYSCMIVSKYVTATRGNPMFLVLCLDNALCQAMSKLAAELQDAFVQVGWKAPSVSTLMAHMKNEATIAELNKKANIIICTPGKLLEMHSRGQVNISSAKKLVLDQADAMLAYAKDDDIQLIFRKLKPEQHVIAFTARSNSLHSSLLALRWNSYAPVGVVTFSQMIQLPDVQVQKLLRFVANHISWRNLRKESTKKEVFAASVMHDEHQESSRQVLGIASWKVTVDAIDGALRTIMPKGTARHRADLPDPDERQKSLKGFKDKAIQVMISTRRSIYGAQFDFLPVVVLPDISDTTDELVLILQWYLALYEDHKVAMKAKADEAAHEVPKVVVLYDTLDRAGRIFRAVVNDLKKMGATLPKDVLDDL